MITLYLLCVILGLFVLTISADKFVDSSSNIAKHLGMSPLLIGMIIIGFGTSAPELVVSILAAIEGNAGIALGNAYGSNITNIALILGSTALFRPIIVESQVVKKELPILIGITVISMGLLFDLQLSRIDSLVLLIIFSLLMMWTILQSKKNKSDQLTLEVEQELQNSSSSFNLKKIALTLVLSFIVLIISSRVLVYGAVGIATIFGVSDLIIGLTIVALGTSLPELASSIIAIKKGESDLAIGNIIGSNLLNSLLVVGVAGVITPVALSKDFFYRDILVMFGLTLSLFFMGIGLKGKGKIGRIKGGILFTCYIIYVGYLIVTSVS